VRVPSPVHRRPPTHSAHDAQRESIPVTPTQPNASRWKGFVEGSAYPPNTSQSEKGGNDWLAEHPDLNSPWLAPRANAQDPESAGEGSADDRRELFGNFGEKKRRIWYKRIHVGLPRWCGWCRCVSSHVVADHAFEQPNGSSVFPFHHLDVVFGRPVARWQHLSPEQKIWRGTEGLNRHGHCGRCHCSCIYDIHHLR
jgi:hypothetical protein